MHVASLQPCGTRSKEEDSAEGPEHSDSHGLAEDQISRTLGSGCISAFARSGGDKKSQCHNLEIF